jgi:hypothetical protein
MREGNAIHDQQLTQRECHNQASRDADSSRVLLCVFRKGAAVFNYSHPVEFQIAEGKL